MKIGYQGIEGSNSEIAAKNFADRLGLNGVEYIPLTTSKRVTVELKHNRIDYGVMAVHNTLGGIVIETREAIKDEHFDEVATETLHIHHSLFAKSKIDFSEVTDVASHIQALRQTVNTRNALIPNANEVEAIDTAIAAKHLSEGKYNDTTAIISRKDAGEKYNLYLLQDNIEDDSENFTEFRLFKNKQ